ncbi:MAG: CotH kinase family protein [Oscillospiraceae bacterium]|nr:CotH kinase family protein [Oscillospiraceae bacterium]
MPKAEYRRLTALVLLLCLLLSGCGAAGTDGAPAPEAAPASEAAPAQEAPAAAPSAEPASPVRISEVMASNKATLADENGDFPDWVELYNAGGAPVRLQGWTLQRDGGSYALPDLSLGAGEYCLLLSGQLDGMKIPAAGCTLRLVDAGGETADVWETPAMGEDESAYRAPDGSLVLTAFPSPGYVNGDEGYRLYQAGRAACEGEPVIGEVMPYNDRCAAINWTYYDWVEISNPWQTPVSLAGYYLSDKGKDRLQYALPNKTLKPGESVVLYCSSEAIPVGNVNTGFSLNSTRETLYLSRADGSLADYVSLHDVPIGCSVGRRTGEGGFFYLDAPSPGKPNVGGERLIAAMPEALTEDGIFEGVESVTVELRGSAPIHYTLDGSYPSAASPLYTGPIEITETTALRAACVQEGYLPSATLDLSYILNEGHVLPVVSLICTKEEMTGPKGLYTRYSEELEREASFTLFEEDGARTQIRCGVKLHGETSRTRVKKSFKLKFADRYDGALDYDLFGNGVTHFTSVLLRAAQEGRPSSYMRDTLMHELASENFPTLPCQDHRYAVLYLNGEYWGIYNLREAHSETHYAQHYGCDEAQVTQTKKIWEHNSMAEEVADFALTADLSDPENFAWLEQHLDLDSVVGWCVLEAYSGNFDANSPNMRFYWTEDDQKLHFALVDLDLGMFSYNAFEIPFANEYEYERLAEALMDNDAFFDAFLRRLGELLRGPLSDEAVHARIDELADELRAETPRDMLRWNNRPHDWESMVRVMHEFIDYNGGRAYMVIKSLKTLRRVDSRTLSEYFPDFGF